MTDPETPEDEPKLIIDDDWKEQVAKEKAAAANSSVADEVVEATDAERGRAADQADTVDQTDDNLSGREDATPPPASLEMLVSMLFTQAMVSLGHFPNPATGKAEVNKPYAKHYIDTLEMLGEKTKGNLSDDESKILADALHAMRMAYVDAKA